MQTQPAQYDIIIIGGGINGCGIARDAAGRGLKVAVLEMGDLAQGTSSASTKLIHGGLRYLEHYAFRLVHEALKEREVLLGLAPHIVWPLRFVLPQMQGMRPAWMLRLGLFMYDHLGGRKILPDTQALDLREHFAGADLKPGFTRGFEYSDCWVDDARLVVLNAMDAAANGAEIMVRTKAVSARRAHDQWAVDIAPEGGLPRTLTSRALVNASGPWADDVTSNILGAGSSKHVRLVQGSHIIVPKLWTHDRAYIFQNSDGRIVFAIPYEDDFTLIGTTDRDFAGDPAHACVSEDEITYLLNAISGYFARPPSRTDVIWSYCGIRALFNDGASAAKDATREYVLQFAVGTPPLLNVFGGKITTYRTLAEAALDKLAPVFPQMPRASWSGTTPLPGGNLPRGGQQQSFLQLRAEYPWLTSQILHRLVRSYGALASEVLAGAKDISALGQHFGAGLYEREVRWLMQREWARSAEDVLWRRSKLGLRLTQAERDELARFMAQG